MGEALRVAARGADSGSVRCEGVDLFLAGGEAAGQEVFHVHPHVFPRFEGGSFPVQAAWEEADRGELDGHAARLRSPLS